MKKGLAPSIGHHLHPTMEPTVVFSFPGFTLFSDGSFSRTFLPASEAPPHSTFINGVASKDISPHASSPNIIRIFLPEIALSSSKKLPTIIYFHAGGFILGSPSGPFVEPICKKLAARGPFVVVCVGYRLAPEHRLPAAFDDCVDGVKWLQQQAAKVGESPTVEPWLDQYADFSACFLMGHSAGGAMVHHVALRVLQDDLSPLKLRGLVMAVPFLGGEERTMSEKNAGEDADATLEMTDATWSLCLPEGANRDHPYANVISAGAPMLEAKRTPPVLIVVGELDMLHDRQVKYAKVLKDAGIDLKVEDIEGGEHGMMVGIHEGQEGERMKRLAVKGEQELHTILTFIQERCKH